ncbi:kinase-like domain-containing protein [Rhizophagus clarus]|uniref:Kinase-like domain-containing protein n=1 Tax=Rhizophagus clarus TaxID=94130 RepID=A0A8H3QB98_9GLOM|nr:kinase-like domain-containing protein [Rhizophagus clarus]
MDNESDSAICKQCFYVCDAKRFQQNFDNWTSGNDVIDKFIQDTQLSAHCDSSKVLEWIPYDKFSDCNYSAEKNVIKANWYGKNWKIEDKNHNVSVILKSLNNLKNIATEFFNEINVAFGITQDPKTKNYMMVLGDECKECNKICNAMHFQQNFGNWTSGNDDIDKLIQAIQLSTHDDLSKALEWIPYDKIINAKYITESEFGKEYSANWIDGKLKYWSNYSQNWERVGQKIFVNLKSLNNLKNLTLKFVNELSTHDDTSKALEWLPYDKFINIKYIAESEFGKEYSANWIDGKLEFWNNYSYDWKRTGQKMFIKEDYELYGITQNLETKTYMIALNSKCKECNSICNAMRFQQNFNNWTSGNDVIDKFIQDTQLSAHNDLSKVLEWMSYDKFSNCKYITENKVIKASWSDWSRNIYNKFVILKSINNLNNIAMEFFNEIDRAIGITQSSETKNYMMILSDVCEKCNYACNAICFQRNFDSWTSGNDDIDELIQNAQLLAHDDASEALEWIPYDKFINIKYITENEFGKEYSANWIDGKFKSWNNYNQDWRRIGQKMFVNLKSLNNSNNLTLKFVNEIKIDSEFYGITQDPKTKNYIMVLNKNKCKECNKICNAMHFQQNFGNWTSGSDDIDELIQAIQLSTHDDPSKAFEWIPYDKIINAKYITESEFGKEYSANWIDGKLESWNNYNQGWGRIGQKMFVNLKSLNNSKNLTLKFVNEIKEDYELYGITQNLETKTYMIVLNNKCKECNKICNAMIFQQNFGKWTSDNNDIDELIQATQLLTHNDPSKALEWIPYDKLINIKYIAESEFEKEYSANWIDGKLKFWSNYCQNWERGQKIFVKLKSLNNSKNLTLKFIKEIKIDYEFYGITQDPKTNNYIMVLNNNKCKECSKICNAMYFQQNFGNWTSCNDDIDELIQAIQLSTHEYASKALEWIPYDKFINIKYIAESEFGKEYSANWIEGKLESWNNYSEDWRRIGQKMFVNLKGLNNSKNLTLKFINEIKEDYEVYGITQNSETKTYMIVLSNKCKECKNICNVMCFRQNFGNWTSGNNDIDKLIQVIQLSTHDYASKALEWIPYDKFINIKYIAESEFGKEYNANWIDGMLDFWDNYSQNWIRTGQKMFVNLKSLNNSENLTLKFVNEIKEDYELFDDYKHVTENKVIKTIWYGKDKHMKLNVPVFLKSINNLNNIATELFKINNKAFGITQNPKTKNYMMVLSNICEKCNCTCNAILFQMNFCNWASGNDDIDKLIQTIQLSTHEYASKALEWIPYDKFINIKYIAESEFGKEYSANWIDGRLKYWNIVSQNWERIGQKMLVNLKSLNNSKNLTLKFINKIKIDYEFYGITQDPVTKNYIMVLNNNKCKECNKICSSRHFQQNFGNWTSDNDDIDELIQVIQLSTHDNPSKALEWIPYNKLINIKYIAESKFGKDYSANWIDGKLKLWNNSSQNWIRTDQKMFVNLKSLNNSKNLTLKFINEIKEDYELYGITQNLETKTYMIVLNNKCKECNNTMCNAMHFQQNFCNWTSGNDDIDKFIQDTQLSVHNDELSYILEWISYDRFYNIKYIIKSGMYKANWIDGCIKKWDNINQNWKREDKNMLVNLKSLDNLSNISLNFITEIKMDYEFYGITQDPETRNYMMLSSHLIYNRSKILEWIPYNRFYGIKYITNAGIYKANWIDGYINFWIHSSQNWNRTGDMVVILKSFNNSKDILLKFMNEINKPCGITQNPETKNYMMVLKYECEKCDKICDVIHFQQNFENWTSDNWNNISQNWKRHYQNMAVILKSLNNSKNISSEFKNEINKPCGITQDPKTKCYMMVLKYECKNCNDMLCNAINFQQNFGSWTSGNDDIDGFIQDTQLLAHKPNEISYALEWIPYDRFYNIKYEIKINQEFYGITQDPETKLYMMQNFGNWTSGNDDIDKYIQYTQLLTHDDASKALEWIPYDRFYDVKYIEENKFGKIYKANWTDGCIDKWDNKIQNWKRYKQNMLVNLKSMNNSLELMTEIDKPYGITQDPETKIYIIVLTNTNSNTNICKKCNYICNAVYFRKNFDNWTSGGFGEVYKANWIDGRIDEWDDENKIWRRYDKDIVVALKSLNNSKNITLEFMNEMILHHKVDLDYRIIKLYGITQDPKTENYIMVMEFADGGSLRKYLTTNYNKLNWNNKISCLDDVISGLKNIHEKELIHRDLHIGNILKLKNNAAITDMGLCKPVNHDAQKNTVYGILPYIAPEILQGRSYTKDADIYSFGIIMYEVISGLPPYYDVIHDENLAIKICQGLRPRFKIKVPQLIIQLIKRCLDADQQNRPSAEEIINILFDWQYNSKIFQVQIEEADEINKRSLKGRIPSTNLGLSYKTHSEAIYKSRSLNFNSLPEPKNSDDYYRHNDNIISIESSVSLSLQINVPQLSTELKNDNVISVESSASSSISQLNVNDNNLPEPKSSNDYYKQSDNMISDESSALLSISQLNINDNNLSEPKISNDYYKQSDNMISVESSDINDNNLPKQKSSDDYYEDDISVKSSASLTICQLDINNNNLPESKDSDDYNKQDDNMINVESSEPLSLQICISQLNINDPEPKNSDDYY